MGKEQDLLEASRSGHYHIIEKILTARIKKSGPLNLTSLRRLPGPNTTDPRNGFTCLHYASLNGHKDIVRILLEHGANPNVVDHNGSSPLHLASWTGDYEIVDMLISINNAGNGNNSSGNNNSQTNDNSAKRTIADINLKNKDNETALHSACQYGHTPVVSLLLTQGADPFVQNIRHETPLDLASQYGRLETIELLLRIRFDLLNEYLPTNRNNNQNSVIRRPHSPLHLASRNGHKSIVKLLLDLGFDVNYLTVNGTALHDAVLCGKNEVVRLLLEAGTNIQLCNDHGQKVTQLLEGLNTSVAKQTRKLIREHIQRINDNNLDDDDQIMNRTNELISPMSDTTTSHISHTNSYGGGQLCGDHSQSEDQDLTIVDSMLQEDMNILYNHQDNNNPDFDDLIMDDEDGTDIQCISPPPGYTDGDHMNEHDDDRHQVDHLYPLSHEHGGRLDCISPSSSLFSTSIFSELASIFDEHLNQRNGTESKCIESNQLMNDGSIESHSAQIKSSNSFTIDDEKLMYRSSTSNQRFFDDDPNDKNRHFHHHQSFNDVAIYGRDSPSRRITSPNLLVGGASSSNILTHDDHLSLGMMMMMSTSLNSKSNFDNVIVNNNNDSVIISSSNYSISSAASSTTNMNKTSGIQPPTKPPRKTIDAKKISKAKSVDQCSVSTKVKLSTLVDHNDNSKVSLGMTRLDSDEKRQPPSSTTIKTNYTESRLSDLVDSSDHSTSQDMNSVISKNENNQTKSKKTKKPQTIVSKLKDNDEVHIDSSLLSSATHHSIDDFYLLYDQAAREEYEKEKSNNHQQDHRSSVNYQCWKQQTPQQQRLQSSSQLLKSKAEVNEQQILTNVNKPIMSNSNRETDNILMPKNDPPSPNSAETEIIHAMEPLRQTNGHYSVSAEPKRTKRRKKAVSILTKNCHHYQDCRDNWTLTDPDNNEQFNENNMEKHENNKKSIGILVQLGNVDKNAKLITRCGVEGHARNRHHRNPNKRQQQRSEQQPNLSTQPSEQKRKNNEQPQSTDYYSAFCETLKFDKKGEKENPFAGLCRGGLTPAKSIGNNRNVTVQPAPSSSNGTMEKKKKTVELSEARKSLRKQRSILSGRAESLTKLNNGKFSVHNHTGNDDNHEEKKKTKSIDQRSSTTMTGAMITQPNNIYATLRKKKKSKSLNGDHQLTVIDIDGGHQQNSDGLHSTDTKDRLLNNKTSILQDQSQQIFLWLKEIDMQQYKDILIQNGYDDLDFMDNNVMDDNDLIEIGIIQALHRDAILRAAQLLPYRTPKLTRDQIQQLSIAEWLAFIHLKQYVDIFHNNGLTELRKIRNIWEVELETMLEIDKCGHRRRILYSLSDFNQRDSMIVSDNSDALSPWLSTDNASTCTNLERERDRTTEQQQNPSTTSWKGWKHARHELINGECQYLVNYLGSTLVRELRGIDSTRASIGKLKSATATSNEKILKILLSISCQGVQFKDSKSNRLICEHEIRNIHCICQDSEDLNYFAYITKDFETNNHYCHVFMSTQTDLVTEIILTLGQAFEIAYQIVLEQYNIHVKQQTTTISATNQASLIAKEHGNLSSSSSGTQNQGDQNNNLHSTFVKLNQPQKSDEQRSSSVNDSIQEHCKVVQQSLNDDVSINEKPIEQEFRLLSTPMLPTSMHIEKDQIEANSKPIMSKVENYTNGTEELYAVVDKSRKTKSKSLQQQPKIINEQKQMNESEKENRPVPPIRSSSTASSNSSTGTRPDSKQQQQSQPKPKPPVRVQSMQNQQKPEVSPKPKNLINKSNTVTSSSMNSKPVLARYQPQLFSFQQPHPNQSNHSESLSPMTNSLPSQVSQVSTFINHNQMIDRKF